MAKTFANLNCCLKLFVLIKFFNYHFVLAQVVVCPNYGLKHPSRYICDDSYDPCPSQWTCVQGLACCISITALQNIHATRLQEQNVRENFERQIQQEQNQPAISAAIQPKPIQNALPITEPTEFVSPINVPYRRNFDYFNPTTSNYRQIASTNGDTIAYPETKPSIDVFDTRQNQNHNQQRTEAMPKFASVFDPNKETTQALTTVEQQRTWSGFTHNLFEPDTRTSTTDDDIWERQTTRNIVTPNQQQRSFTGPRNLLWTVSLKVVSPFNNANARAEGQSDFVKIASNHVIDNVNSNNNFVTPQSQPPNVTRATSFYTLRSDDILDEDVRDFLHLNSLASRLREKTMSGDEKSKNEEQKQFDRLSNADPFNNRLVHDFRYSTSNALKNDVSAPVINEIDLFTEKVVRGDSASNFAKQFQVDAKAETSTRAATTKSTNVETTEIVDFPTPVKFNLESNGSKIPSQATTDNNPTTVTNRLSKLMMNQTVSATNFVANPFPQQSQNRSKLSLENAQTTTTAVTLNLELLANRLNKIENANDKKELFFKLFPTTKEFDRATGATTTTTDQRQTQNMELEITSFISPGNVNDNNNNNSSSSSITFSTTTSNVSDFNATIGHSSDLNLVNFTTDTRTSLPVSINTHSTFIQSTTTDNKIFDITTLKSNNVTIFDNKFNSNLPMTNNTVADVTHGTVTSTVGVASQSTFPTVSMTSSTSPIVSITTSTISTVPVTTSTIPTVPVTTSTFPTVPITTSTSMTATSKQGTVFEINANPINGFSTDSNFVAKNAGKSTGSVPRNLARLPSKSEDRDFLARLAGYNGKSGTCQKKAFPDGRWKINLDGARASIIRVLQCHHDMQCPGTQKCCPAWGVWGVIDGLVCIDIEP